MGLSRVGLAASVLMAVGCGNASKSTITIGSILSQTGTLATIGNEQLQAAQMAIDEINAAGGVLGGQLALMNIDDRSTPAGATAAAQTLVGAKVPAVVGAIASGSTIPASMVLAPAKIMQISGASTSPAITGMSPYLARTCPSDALQGQLLAKRAVAKGFTKVAIVFIPGPYGMGLSDTFDSSFTAQGGTITFKQPYTEGQSSYTTLLSQIFATNPDAVLLIAYPVDGAQIIKDYNSAFSSKAVFWYFTDALEDPSWVQAIGATNFTFMHEGTGPATPSGPAYATYGASFMAKYGRKADPGTFSPNVYDAVYILALAMEQSHKTDGTSISGALRTVSDPPGMTILPGQWAAALTALQGGAKVNFDGSSGPVDIDDMGNVVSPYAIWKVSGGMITVVEPSVTP